MYQGLLHSHSGLRYIVLILLLAVIVKSTIGWLGKKPFTGIDNKLSLWLLITTHIQFLLGLVLYFQSPWVQFSGDTMGNSQLRYWTVEHVVAMLIAVVLITIARSTSKRMKEDEARHKRLAIFNEMAFFIILITIWLGGRGILSMNM
ncbi:MAG: cytochrome B [Flammeovirgaceae bacterium]|nr:cytochrome B [Flammeovirgaceae bacterium]